jgi:ankyrin repeat protein
MRMADVDWSELDRLKAERPALILELMTAGDAEGFRRALESGFDVNAASDVGGSMRTPAHHAAAAGDVTCLRLLVEHGADLTAVDPTYNATPLGWAEFFDKPEAAAYLREV